jgi:hypothetical protein
MLAGCGEHGKVEQGRTVAFDKEKSQVTIIVDDNIDPKKPPNYATRPVHVYTLPAVGPERGADPVPALRMNLNVENKTITMYNPQTKALETLSFEVVEDHKDVDVRRQNPLVYDRATRKAISFPKIDEANRVLTLYSPRQLRLTSIKLSEADFAKYKGKDWDVGDEVRIYYKEQGKALRFMNITKTNIRRR